MNRDLFLAILSMDTYNRGYGRGVNLTVGASTEPRNESGGRIGNATIILQSDVDQGELGVNASFYALAYDVSGAGIAGLTGTVIAYRGSDYEDTNGNIVRSNDLWQGWTVGIGFSGAEQAGLALAFYTAVTGQSPYNTPGAVTLTGHSLGGALAGFVSALSGNQALLFDNLPFGVAAYLQSEAATGTVNTVQPGLPDAYYVEGDVAALTRAGGLSLAAAGLSGTAIGAFFANPLIGAAAGLVAGTPLAATTAYLDGLVDNQQLSQFNAAIGMSDAHAQALLVTLLWARDNTTADWHAAARYILPQTFSEDVAAHLSEAQDRIGRPTATPGYVMQSAIAYSALDSGERPFGDVAIRAMFDDAGDFGTVLQSGRLPSWLGERGNAVIGRIIVEFAGSMALRDVEALGNGVGGPNVAALSGVIALDNVNNPSVMRISFGDELWGLGEGDPYESAEREGLINIAVDATSSNAEIERISTWYAEQSGGDLLEEIDEIVFAFGDGLVSPSLASGLSLVVAGDAGVNTTLDNNQHFVITGAGADVITGGTGVDIIISGDGAGELHGGGGNDYLVGGANGDDLYGDGDNDYLDGGFGVDHLFGGAGDDRLVASLDNEADELDGGTGEDTVVYAYDQGDSTIRLRTTAQVGPGVNSEPAGFGLEISGAQNAGGSTIAQFGGDTLTSIELAAIQAGTGADTLRIDTDIANLRVDYIDLGREPSGSYDYVDLSNWTESVTVNLSQNLVELPSATLSFRGVDAVIGGAGDDTITGNDDSNRLIGGAGENTISGGGGNDTVEGGVDVDYLSGGTGNDIIKGDWGDDQLQGEIGNDTLIGGRGEDQLFGGDDNDIIDGLTGEDSAFADQLYGGEGADRFLANNGDTIRDLDSSDRSVKFKTITLSGGLRKQGDDFYTGAAGERYTWSGSDLVVTFQRGAYAGQRLTINNFVSGAGGIKLRNQDDPNEPGPEDNFPDIFPSRDPLVLDLNGNGVTLTNLALSQAFFDLDLNGFAERTGWVGAGEGLLALDVNRNGIIDNGSELFGNATLNGFEVLARYDDNRDGQITSSDVVWNNLLIWRDADRNGVSAASEITSIETEAITGINLSARDAGRQSREGNPLLAVGDFGQSDGFRAEAVAVAFRTNQSNTNFAIPENFEFDPEVFGLPNLKGFGDLPDLWVAMTLDPVLKQMVMELIAGSYENITDLVGTPYQISVPPRREFGIFRDQSATFHYRASAFEDVLARWAGVPIFEGDFDEIQVELTAQRLIGQDITIGTGFARRDFHNAFLRNSVEYATRFVIAWADSAQNSTNEQEISAILEQLNGDVSDSVAAALQETLNSLLSEETRSSNVLNPFLQRYALLDYDAVTNQIVGDVAGFIDSELQSFAFNPDNPYEGWSEWVADRLSILGMVDPSGSILDERRRAYTGNRMLGIFLTPEAGLATRITGDGIVIGDAGLNVLSGGTGNDVLIGNGADDAYVFTDGFGQDVVVDGAGNADEIAFQGSLTSTLARVSIEGLRGRDIRISFEGRSESVLIRDYFGDLYNPNTDSIDRISFPDGPLWDARSLRDRAYAAQATDGSDRIRGELLGTTIVGGAGDDVLGYSVAEVRLRNSFASPLIGGTYGGDIFVGGTGNDLLQGTKQQSTYRFSSGDGHDTIFDLSGSSTIQFDETIRPEDISVAVAENGRDVILWIGGHDQSITLQEFLRNTRGDASGTMRSFAAADEPFQLLFSNGFKWSFDDLLTRALQGSDGADTLGAFTTGSTLSGGGGNDRLFGFINDDIYIGGEGDDQFFDMFGADEFRFSLGDGHDVMTVDRPQNVAGRVDDVHTKTIVFDNTIAENDVTFEQSDDGLALTIWIAGADQSITITDFMRAIDRVYLRFIGGQTINGRQLLAAALAPTAGDDSHIGSVYSEVISGGDGNDELLGGRGSVSGAGYHGDDTLDGGAGDDLLIGRSGADLLIGGAGNDFLDSGGGSDTLIGGTGNDFLRGGSYADIHRFALGDGHDIIEFSDIGDVIDFENSISLSDITVNVSDDGNDLILNINGPDQSITLRGVMFNNAWGANEIRFDGETAFTISDLILSTQVATDGDDIIQGSYHGTQLLGGAGNDTIIGGAGNDVIEGGSGADILSGRGGANVFRFGIGSGADRIVGDARSVSSQDIVEFGQSIDPEDIVVSLSENGSAIVLTIAGTTDSLTIERGHHILQNGEFRFTNTGNDILTPLDLLGGLFGATAGNDVIYGEYGESVLEGLDGNDFLSSFYGNTIFVGGRGDDILEGSRSRPDVYRFSRGDGQDTIIDTINQDFGDDDYFQDPSRRFEGNVIEFGDGISVSDIAIFETADNNIPGYAITIAGTADRIFFGAVGDESSFHITEMRFSNGTVLRNGPFPPMQGQPSISDLIVSGTLAGSSLIGSGVGQVLDGRGSIQSLVGNGGNDTFIFNLGYGDLTIDQSQTVQPNNSPTAVESTLRFGLGISANDVAVSTNAAGDLLLSLGGDDNLTILRGRSEAPRPIESGSFFTFSGVTHFEFSDGTVWTYDDVISDFYIGAADNLTLVGDAFGGTFDSRGLAREIFSASGQDKILYNQGYGSLIVSVTDHGANGGPEIQFGSNLHPSNADVSIKENGALVLDFGNGDVIEIVDAVNTDSSGNLLTYFTYVFNEFFGGTIEYDVYQLIDAVNDDRLAQALQDDQHTPLTLLGLHDSNSFDTQGLDATIDGGGGTDYVVYERGYGELIINVAPDTGDTSGGDQNAIYINFGSSISRQNIQIRTGRENELVVDLGDGDIIRLQFERDPALDLIERTFPLPGNENYQSYYGGAVEFYFEDGDGLSGPDILQLAVQNFAPLIGAGTVSADLEPSENQALTIAGEFAFDDADAADDHQILVVGVSVQGNGASLPSNEVLQSYMFTQIAQDADVGTPGQARWIFSAGAGTFDYLADGETITLDYALEVYDGRTGSALQTVSIVVNGTNQAPQIFGGVSGATLLPANALAGSNGQISFTDLDLSDSHAVTVQSVVIAGNAEGLPSIEDVRNWLDTNLVTGPAGNHLIDWSFAPQGHSFAALALSDQLSLTYAVQIQDTAGAVVSHDITIIIRPSTLAAGTLAAASGLVFQEDGVVDLAIPSILFANSIAGDLLVSASLSDGSPLPTWLHFDGSRLTGAPPANFSGIIDLRITANNGTDAVHDFLPLVIEAVNDAPVVAANISDYRIETGAAVNILLPQNAFTDVDGDRLQLSARLQDGAILPSWLQFANGAFVGTPPAGFAGTIAVTVTASDGMLSADQSINLVFGGANAAPSVANLLYDWQIREDEFVDIALRQGVFQDIDGDSLSISASLASGATLPDWLLFNGSGFTGTPPTNYNGIIDIAVTASDGQASVTDTFRLIIDPLNDAPIVSRALPSVSIANGTNFNVAIPADTFIDADGDILTLSAQLANGDPLPDWMQFDGVSITGTPPVGVSGNFTLRVGASDGSLGAATEFTLAIASSNAAPVALADFLSTIGEDSVVEMAVASLLANDTDADGNSLTITGVSEVLGGTAEFLENGVIRFTATPNYNGPASFRYAISDGQGGVSSAVASFNIVPQNDAPVGLDDNGFATNEDTPLEISVATLLANDSDLDGDTLSITAIEQSIGGEAVIDSNVVRFTPTANFYGDASFSYVVSDGQGGSSVAVVALSVLPVNDPPIVMSQITDLAVNEDDAVELLLPADAFVDVDGQTLTLAAQLSSGNPLPSWLQFDGSRLSGQPPANFNGVLAVTVTATDGLATAAQQILLTINAVNDAPTLAAALPDVQLIEDAAVDVLLPAGTFSDIDSDALTYSATLGDGAALPDWLTIDGTSGRLTGTPPANFTGALDIIVTASDGALSASDTFRLEVTPQNDAPMLVSLLADVAVNEDSVIDFILPVGSFADIDGDVLTFAASLANGSALPSWLSFDATTRRFTGTPPADFNGLVDVQVTASDGALSVSDTFQLTVTPVNDAPVVTSALVDRVFTEDTFIDFTLPAGSFTDLDGPALSYAATLGGGSALPSWLSFDPATQRFTGTPPADFNGFLDVLVAASDGTLSVSDEFRLTVTATNDAPTLVVALTDRSSAEDTAIDFTIPANSFADVDGSALTLSATLAGGTALPSWLSFDAATRRFTGTPPANFNGIVDVQVTASDGGLTVSDEFRLTVTPVNDAPVAVNDGLYVTTSNNPITISRASLLANDSDVDGTPLNITSVGNAAGGSVAINTAGDIVFTPASGFSGNASFQYTLSDGTLSAQANVAVRVDSADPFATWRQGTEGVDILFGNLFGANRIYGRAGNDLITGGLLTDQLAGGDGNDILTGLSGNDEFWGGSGNDILLGGGGTDTAYYYGLRSSYALITQGGILSLRVTDNQPSVDGDDGSDQLSSVERLSFNGGETVNVTSPIILDLDGNGVRTVSAADSNARYDLDGDGLADDTSWIGSTEGFLFLDRDGNGTVSNAGEFSFIDDATDARSDLEGLRAFDSNRDGLLSSLDVRFGEFRVWQDRDGDGAAETGEILTLATAGVRSLNLTGTAVNGTTEFGDVAVINRGSYTRTNGTTMSFLDAALTYFSSATNLPQIAVQELDFGRRSGRYSISFGGGAMTINPNRRRGEIDTRAGALDASSLLSFRNQTIGMLSPIILDLDGDGVEMRSIKKSKAAFDMNGDGIADDTGWAGRDDGFLVIDRNNDGRITHASELSFAAEDADARSDLEALAALDNNGDGVLNDQDVRFGELKVWQDANGNGVTDAGELKTLAEVGITEISLRAQNREGSAGIGDNILLGTSSFTRANGSTGTVGNAVLAYRPGTGTPPAPTGNRGGFDRMPFDFPTESDVSNDIIARNSNVVGEIGSLVAALRNGQGSGVSGFGLQLPGNIDPFDYYAQPLQPLPAAAPPAGLDSSITSMKSGGSVPMPPVMDVLPQGWSDGSAASKSELTDVINRPVMDALPKDWVDESDLVPSESAAPANVDRRLALMRQDMAAFGAITGENSSPWRRESINRVVEFHA